MASSEQIEQFNLFAKQLSVGEGLGIPLDVIFDRWHTESHEDQDILAIQASDRDYERGERGRPVAEQDFDAMRSGVEKST